MLVEPLKVTDRATGFYEHGLKTTGSRLAPMPTKLLVSWIPDALPRGAKWPSYEADYPSQTSSRIKNMWSCTSTRLFGVVLIQTRKQFPFSFYTYSNICVGDCPLRLRAPGLLIIGLRVNAHALARG